MLVITRLRPDRVHRLDFGSSLEPPSGVGAHVRWVLADYEARRDDLWDVPPIAGQGELVALLAEAGDDTARLLVVLDAMRFYAVPEPGANAVLRYLDHPDRNVRLYALGALGSMAKYSTVEKIGPFLRSADSSERIAAANALAKIPTPESLANLETAANDDPALVPALERGRERREIVDEGWVSGLVDPLVEGEEDYEDLCLFSNVTVRQLALVASEEGRPVAERRRALRVVGLTRQRKYAADTTLEVLQDDAADASLRRAAAWALGRMRDPRALPVFDRLLLAGVDKPFELTTIEAIGRIGRSRSLGTLLNHHARRDDAEVHRQIGTALARISEPIRASDEAWDEQSPTAAWLYVVTDEGALLTENVVPALLSELRAPEGAARLDALFALSLVEEDPGVDAALTAAAAEDPEEGMRAAARRALGRRQVRRERR